MLHIICRFVERSGVPAKDPVGIARDSRKYANTSRFPLPPISQHEGSSHQEETRGVNVLRECLQWDRLEGLDVEEKLETRERD